MFWHATLLSSSFELCWSVMLTGALIVFLRKDRYVKLFAWLNVPLASDAFVIHQVLWYSNRVSGGDSADYPP